MDLYSIVKDEVETAQKAGNIELYKQSLGVYKKIGEMQNEVNAN